MACGGRVEPLTEGQDAAGEAPWPVWGEVWGIFGWLVGKGEVGTPIAGDDVRTGVAGLANGPGHD